MGLNKLFRRLTVQRLGGNNNYPREKLRKGSKECDCKHISATDNELYNSNPDLLPHFCYNKKKMSASCRTSNLAYPSCPSLNGPPTGQNNNEISSCCVSSSSLSLTTRQELNFSKGLTPLVNLKRSITSIRPNQKKRSWLQPHLSNVAPMVEKIQLPENLFIKCIEQIHDPFELCRLKFINSSVYYNIQQRLERVVEMDVRKIKFDSISILSSSNLPSSSTMLVDNKIWYSDKLGHKVFMRFADNGRRVEILVDDCWTSKDIVVLCRIMDMFRLTLTRISLDAPIFELVIASLSIIDLDRWYAFQCFMKAVNDFQIHLAVTQLPQNKDFNELYWPNAEALVIRTTELNSAHLSRILDYGVRSRLVMDRRRLDVLKIILTDVNKMSRSLIRNLYHFRCWAGSAGFDDRFSQQYCVDVA